MEITQKGKTLTNKEVIMNIKQLYDNSGPTACGSVFQHMLKEEKTKEIAEAVIFLIKLVHKIDTCSSTCFEDLAVKQACSCKCNNDEMVIPFNEDGSLNL